MNKVIISVIVVILLVITYFALSGQDDGGIQSEGSSTIQLGTVRKQVKFNGCDIAIEKKETLLRKISLCEQRKVTYNGQESAIVYLAGGGDEYLIVLSDGTIQPVETELFFNPTAAVKSYVKDVNGIELTDKELKTAVSGLHPSKRGLLFGLTFDDTYEGTVYITQQGKLSGKLFKK